MILKERIRNFIKENLLVFNETPAEIADDVNIFQQGFVNSLFAMKLLNYVESEFCITIDSEDVNLANFSTVNNISRLVENKTRVQV